MISRSIRNCLFSRRNAASSLCSYSYELRNLHPNLRCNWSTRLWNGFHQIGSIPAVKPALYGLAPTSFDNPDQIQQTTKFHILLVDTCQSMDVTVRMRINSPK